MAVEDDEMYGEMATCMRKVMHLMQTHTARRSFKATEQRVLEATAYQDMSNSVGEPYRYENVSNHARALINDRETLDNLYRVFSEPVIFDIMLTNLLYEPARTHLLERVRQSVARYVA